MSGDPTKGRFSDYEVELERARAAGLKVSAHAAEVPNSEEVDKILDFKPDRLGHFLCVTDKQLQRAIDDETPVEICPASNCCTLGLPHFSHHPTLKSLVAANHPVSFSTDDPGVFDTTASHSLALAAEALGWDEWRCAGAVWDAVDQVFEGNRRVRSRVAREVRLKIKRMLGVLEGLEGVKREDKELQGGRKS